MTLAVVTPKTDPQLATLFSLAESLGYDLTPTSKNRREIALSILNRMRPRTGTNVYQSAAFSLYSIPRARPWRRSCRRTDLGGAEQARHDQGLLVLKGAGDAAASSRHGLPSAR